VKIQKNQFLEPTLNDNTTFLLLRKLKSRTIHIFSSLSLIVALLFTQVGATFYHSNHDVHLNKSITKPLEKGKAGLQKHDEHCKLCSIDFFHQALISSSLLLPATRCAIVLNELSSPGIKQSLTSFLKGRAPPLQL
jgi:hypothetical protein